MCGGGLWVCGRCCVWEVLCVRGILRAVCHCHCHQVAQHMLKSCETLTNKQLRAGKDKGEAVALWEHGTQAIDQHALTTWFDQMG